MKRGTSLGQPREGASSLSSLLQASAVKWLKNCALLDYYMASSGNSLATFRDDLSLPSSRIRIVDGDERFSRNVANALPQFAA